MAKQTEKAMRREKILELLLEKPYFQQELIQILGISKKSLQDDIKFLVEQGYNIPKHSKKNGYVIPDEEKDRIRKMMSTAGKIVVNENLVSGHIQKSIILLILQKENRYMSLGEITKDFIDYIDSAGVISDDQSLMNSIRYSIEGRDGIGLIPEGFVEKSEEDSTYRVTKKSPMLLTLDWDEAQDILYAIRAFGNSYALRSTLKSVEAKLSVALYSEVETSDENLLITYGNRINRNKDIERQLDMLRNVPYERRVIALKYNDNEICFKVGILVYVADKDKLYLVGDRRYADSEEYMNNIILNAEKVSDVRILEEKNDIFRSQYYMDIYHEMFSMSCKDRVHVEIEYDLFGNVPKKLEHLASTRKNAVIRIDKEAGTGTYIDDVRGLEDLAKYLRRYGKSLRVKEPEELKEKMKFTVERMKERYRSEGLYE